MPSVFTKLELGMKSGSLEVWGQPQVQINGCLPPLSGGYRIRLIACPDVFARNKYVRQISHHRFICSLKKCGMTVELRLK